METRPPVEIFDYAAVIIIIFIQLVLVVRRYIADKIRLSHGIKARTERRN